MRRSPPRSPRSGGYKGYPPKQSSKSSSRTRTRSKSPRHSERPRDYDNRGKEPQRDDRKPEPPTRTFPVERRKDRDEPSAQPSKVINNYKESEINTKSQQYVGQSANINQSFSGTSSVTDKRPEKLINQPIVKQGNIITDSLLPISKLFPSYYFILLSSL